MIHDHFHQAPAVEQSPFAEPLIIDPIENEVQWDNWPAHPPNIHPVQQAPDELSMEVSGLSIGLNSGSTNLSGNSTALMTLLHSVEQSTQVPSALSTPTQAKPPIKFFYSRRNKGSAKEGHDTEKASPLKAIVSFSVKGVFFKTDKGKGIMPEKPTLQDFMNAANEDGTGTQLVRGCGISIRDVDE
ncbi:hypothetical protein GUJ93_ZPchr0016g2526 [Zizania palustris]|uniref:Uncharacterized protein n=1 Tax=Zizania palustris TaxID=103762 RepID=A0A8J5TDJ3_ZIZPA|nr:hypothetical protein GUJ93_ZPchr0016g2526 [Zizania palustris]